MLIYHTKVLHTFHVTIVFFTLLELFQCQVPKELSKASTLPFNKGKDTWRNLPSGKKNKSRLSSSHRIFLQFHCSCDSARIYLKYSTRYWKCEVFSKPIQQSKMKFVRRMSMGMFLFRQPLSHQTSAIANSSALHKLWFNTREQWN